MGEKGDVECAHGFCRSECVRVGELCEQLQPRAELVPRKLRRRVGAGQREEVRDEVAIVPLRQRRALLQDREQLNFVRRRIEPVTGVLALWDASARIPLRIASDRPGQSPAGLTHDEATSRALYGSCAHSDPATTVPPPRHRLPVDQRRPVPTRGRRCQHRSTRQLVAL